MGKVFSRKALITRTVRFIFLRY